MNLDVLNSQTQLFQTQRDLAKARYDVIVADLPEVINGATQEFVQRARNVYLVATQELIPLKLASRRLEELAACTCANIRNIQRCGTSAQSRRSIVYCHAVIRIVEHKARIIPNNARSFPYCHALICARYARHGCCAVANHYASNRAHSNTATRYCQGASPSKCQSRCLK